MTGVQLELRGLEASCKNPKAKSSFVRQREMVKKLWGTDAEAVAHQVEWEERLAKIGKKSPFGH
jgi:hypothetical protein